MTQDVTIPVELMCMRSRYFSDSIHGRLYVVELCGFQIVNDITEKQYSDLFDLFCSENSKITRTAVVDYSLEFEVSFDSEGEIEHVSLNCNDIINILSDGILKELKKKAKADHIADLKDRGIKYKGGA